MPEQTLAQRIKAKFPGEYDDIPDAELETKILERYPEYADLPRTDPARDSGSGQRSGVFPSFEDRINAGEFTTQVAPSGPKPNSPADLTRRAFEGVFGRLAPQAQEGARRGLALSPASALTSLVEGGAPQGGAVGGTVAGLLAGPGGAVAGAGAGGAAGGAAERWWKGEPVGSGGDIAGDVAGQAALQAVAPVIGASMQGVARPIYRAALSPGSGLVKTFGDVGKTGLEEGIPVGAGSAERAAAKTSASRAEALRLVADAEQAGAPNVDASDIQPALDRVFRKSRDAASVGADPPARRLMDRSQKIGRAFGGPGVKLTRAQTLKEVAQDEAATAFNAADRGARVSTLDDEAAADIAEALQREIEARAPGVAGQNAKTKALLGLTKALENADARRVGSSGLPSRSVLSVLAVPQVASRGAIGMHRTGKAVKNYGPMVTNLLRMLAAQSGE